jgi:hypothetical protein
MDKFEKTLPESIKHYAVNNTTVFAYMGLLVFAGVGLTFLFKSVFSLFALVWVYTMDGHDLTRAGLTFGLATFCFIVALICRKGFVYCWGKLQQYQLSE